MTNLRVFRLAVVALIVFGVVAVACGSGGGDPTARSVSNPLVGGGPTPTTGPRLVIKTVPGMPPVVDPTNLYSETTSAKMLDVVKEDLPRVYVPNRAENTVSVIDPNTMQVIEKFPVGINPQHIVPSWDLRTLWVTNTAEGRTDGSLTPIDPRTGKRSGPDVPVDDPYNMYYSPDGRSAIVVAEAYKRLDFRDPKTMALQKSIETPSCNGVNHGEFAIDGTWAVFTCEFAGALIKIDMASGQVVSFLQLSGGGMPQDIRLSPDGSMLYVAEMVRSGVYLVDPVTFTEVGFIPTGTGAHGLYPSRDASVLYVANRGSTRVGGPPNGQGSVSVLDWRNGDKVVATWPVPGGGSPDMGGVSADGTKLWLAGRYDNEVYAIDTRTGEYTVIPVGREPHGLAIWPQPGRYSLGHTSNLR